MVSEGSGSLILIENLVIRTPLYSTTMKANFLGPAALQISIVTLSIEPASRSSLDLAILALPASQHFSNRLSAGPIHPLGERDFRKIDGLLFRTLAAVVARFFSVGKLDVEAGSQQRAPINMVIIGAIAFDVRLAGFPRRFSKFYEIIRSHFCSRLVAGLRHGMERPRTADHIRIAGGRSKVPRFALGPGNMPGRI